MLKGILYVVSGFRPGRACWGPHFENIQSDKQQKCDCPCVIRGKTFDLNELECEEALLLL